MSSSARWATSVGRVCCLRMVKSGLTNSPPLKPAIGVSSLSASAIMAMPRGGRPLVTAKRMPRSCRLCTAACARSVSTFCSLTSVPSTSASTREIFRLSAIAASAGGSLERAPGASVARQELVGGGRALAAGGIVGEVLGRVARPVVEDGLHGPPARLDVVGTLEEGGIADHAVVEQRLVAGGGRRIEIGLVGEVHADVAEIHGEAGPLGGELQRNAFVRLDAQDHPVGIHLVDMRAAEQGVRRLVEADRDLGLALLQVLAGAQVERHARPAPVVDVQLPRHIGLDTRIGRDIGLFAIAAGGLAQNAAGAVLAAHHIALDERGRRRTNGLDDL